MFHRPNGISARPELKSLFQCIAVKRYGVKIWQEAAPSPIVGVAYVVTTLYTFPG